MNQDIKSYDEYYRENYKYDIPAGQERAHMVGALLLPVLRNDLKAVEKLILLMRDTAFWLIKKALEPCNTRFKNIDTLEDVMEEVTGEMRRACRRGFPEYVTEDGFYGYMYRLVEKSAIRFVKKYTKNQEFDESFEAKLQESGEGFIYKLYTNEDVSGIQQIKEDIILEFIKTIGEAGIEPHRIITYCYACLLPIVFKSTQNETVLLKMDAMSGRAYPEKTSGYEWDSRKDRFILWGEIARRSGVLLNWAVDAMFAQNVDFLQAEFQRVYNMEPIGDVELKWGTIFYENLESDCKNKKEKDVVITSDFTRDAIKNWPNRVSVKIYGEVRKKFMADEYYEAMASCYR